MPLSTTFANDLMALIFQATAIANIADNAGTDPLTSLYVGLYEADPGIGGSQETNETDYTNYARVAVARTSGGWDVAAGVAENDDLLQFPQCGASGATVTHVAIGTAASGAGKVLFAGALSASLAVSNLIQPQFPANALTAELT